MQKKQLKNIRDPREFFKPEEIKSMMGENLAGKVLVLNPNALAPQFQNRAGMLWRAGGGFGCYPSSRGRAVFATCIADGENARWDRADFIGIFVGEQVAIMKACVAAFADKAPAAA